MAQGGPTKSQSSPLTTIGLLLFMVWYHLTLLIVKLPLLFLYIPRFNSDRDQNFLPGWHYRLLDRISKLHYLVAGRLLASTRKATGRHLYPREMPKDRDVTLDQLDI